MGRASGRSAMDIVGWAAVGAMVAGIGAAWLRLLPALPGFALYALGGIAAIVAALSALVASARRRSFGRGRAVAILAAMVFIVSAAPGFGPPPINDFTTDLAEPPQFQRALELQPNQGRDMGYPADFAQIQRDCCPDLATERLAETPEAAFDRARRAAESMPDWEILVADPATGLIEAVATSRVFGFQDDIAIRVRADSAGSKVDVRSKSRDGRGDQGANAARIRAYLEVLRAG